MEFIPLALTTTKVVLDIVDGVTGDGLTLVVLSVLELGTESLVVLVAGLLVEDNALLVVGDLEGQELYLALAETELVELVDDRIIDGNSMGRKSIRRQRGGEVIGKRFHTRMRAAKRND